MSNEKVITINPTLHKILVESRGSFLSIKVIKEQFILATGVQLSSDELSRVIYRQLLRLLQHKVIEKKLIAKKKYLGYQVTQSFDNVTFKFREFKCEIEAASPDKSDNQHNLAIDTLNTLKNQLTQHEVDFQASIAESEEYKRLLKITPEMKPVLETYFINARNQSNQLLGKITAVKNIISKVTESKCS